MTIGEEPDPLSTAPPSYRTRGRITTLGLKRKRNVESVYLTGMRQDANEALPVLAEFPQLHKLWLIAGHGLHLGFVGDLDHLTELALDACAETTPSPLVLPRSLRRLTIAVEEPNELESLCRELDWSRVPDLDYLNLRVNYDQPPARLDLGLIDHLPALRVLQLYGVWHDGPDRSPLEPPFDRLPPNIANGGLTFEAACPDVVADALYAHLGLPVVPRTPEREAPIGTERAKIEKTGRGQPPIEQPPYEPDLYVQPLRDPAPTPPDPDWMLYRADDDAQRPWWTSGTLAPDDDPDVPEGPLGDELAATIKRADPQLRARIDTESDSEETFIFAQNPEDLEAALRIAGLTSPGIAD
jgi:hypothetical protein